MVGLQVYRGKVPADRAGHSAWCFYFLIDEPAEDVYVPAAFLDPFDRITSPADRPPETVDHCPELGHQRWEVCLVEGKAELQRVPVCRGIDQLTTQLHLSPPVPKQPEVQPAFEGVERRLAVQLLVQPFQAWQEPIQVFVPQQGQPSPGTPPDTSAVHHSQFPSL